MDHYLKPNTILGILGGGQLGKMLLQKAADFNITSHVLDPDENAPCRFLCNKFEHGSFADYNAVLNFGNECDIITIEIEHVNTEALFELEALGKKIFPQPHIIKMVQDKGLQKQFFAQHNFPTADFYLINNKSEIKENSFPIIQKTRTDGYDGKGVKKINTYSELQNAFDVPSVIEECVVIEKEISVLVSRNLNGEVSSFPVVEMEFNKEANVVEFLFSPAGIDNVTQTNATEIAERLVDNLQMVGLLAVEMFVTKNGEVLINEIAPRLHNSGHHTIEANITSQFEQHLRAIFNLPPGNTQTIMPSVMVNLLGEKGFEGKAVYKGIQEVLKISGVNIHLYGKKTTKPFRKMGHVTVTAANLSEAIKNAKKIKEVLKVVA